MRAVVLLSASVIVGGLIGVAMVVAIDAVWRHAKTASRPRGWAWPSGPGSAGSPRHARRPR